jgi:hypothetical protein
VYSAGETVVNGVSDSFSYAVSTIDQTTRDSINLTKGMIGSGIQTVDDTVTGARNFAADIVSDGGTVVGVGGGLAGEVTMIVATAPLCCIPYLFIGGSAMELGKQFSDSTGEFSKHIRGSRPQFVGIHKDEGLFYEDLQAIIYLPEDASSDSKGFSFISERDLNSRRATTDASKKALFETALFALQDAKVNSGMSLDCPSLKAEMETSALAKAPKIKSIK